MNVAIIPARGGSKRIPRKNVREFAGKPMIAYSIRDLSTAVSSGNRGQCAMHPEPYCRWLGYGPGDFPEAERYYGEAMTLPLFPARVEDERDVVMAALTREME